MVTVEGSLAKDGSPTGNARSVIDERQAAVRGVEPGHHAVSEGRPLKKSLRTALLGATAVVVFSSSAWVLGAQQGGRALAPLRRAGQGGGRGRGRQAGPVAPDAATCRRHRELRPRAR